MIVCLLWSFSRMRAKMYSFQLVMKAKTDVATRPGATSGRRIRTNAPSRVLPSTIAASSSSFGMPRMNPRSIQTQNGSTERDVDDDHARQRVRLVVPREHDVERDDQRRLRQHLDPDHEDDEERAAGEPVLRERDGGQERERDRDRHRHEDDDQAVLHVVPEERLVDRGREVRQRRVERHPRRRQSVDLVVALERGRDHPEDREDEHDEDREADGVPPACRARRRRRRRARASACAAAPAPTCAVTARPRSAPSGARRRRSSAPRSPPSGSRSSRRVRSRS